MLKEIEGMNQSGLLIRLFGTFWGTVMAVEIMDITFLRLIAFWQRSVSVTRIWILIVGGMLGVLMMRGVAGVFLTLIDRVPELETTAYILILIISVKMFLSVFHIEIAASILFYYLIINVWRYLYRSLQKQEKSQKGG